MERAFVGTTDVSVTIILTAFALSAYRLAAARPTMAHVRCAWWACGVGMVAGVDGAEDAQHVDCDEGSCFVTNNTTSAVAACYAATRC